MQHVRCAHKGREMWTIFFKVSGGSTHDPAGSSDMVQQVRYVQQFNVC